MIVPCQRSRAHVGLLAIALAVAMPGSAAAQDAEAGPASGAPSATRAPLTEFDDFGVEWPDMSEIGDGATGAAAGRVAIDAEQRYEVVLRGLDEIEGEGDLRSQFNALSRLHQGEGRRAVVAQIDRRADADRELMRQLLRSRGYYDARVVVDLGGETGEGRVEVVFEIEPGPLYRFGSVELPGLDAAGARTEELRGQFPVDEEDPVDAAAVGAAQLNLRSELGNRGYPFAEVGEEEVTVDHANRIATLRQPVDPGGERDFGAIRVSEGADEIFDADHVGVIARFDPGDLYSTRLVDDLRRALIQTGLVSRVDITPVETGDPELVDLDIAMEPAPPRTITGQIGYGTGQGFSVEGSWEHRNLIRPEGALNVRGVLGTEEQYGGLTFRRSNFLDRDQLLSAGIYASNLSRDAYDARTLGLTFSIERISNQLWQKTWTWSAGLELLATDESDVAQLIATNQRTTYFIGAIPLHLGYDGTNDLLNPERGMRFAILVSPELSLEGGTNAYARLQLDGSVYVPLGGALTLASRVRVGSMPGAILDEIAPSRRFYVGGGGSVRGYSYQAIGPRDINNDPIGGRSLVEMALEARYRFGSFGIVPFIDAGALYTSVYPDFSDLRFGAGLGVRYYSSFGPIRVDVGTPINPQPGDPFIAVYVSLGQAF